VTKTIAVKTTSGETTSGHSMGGRETIEAPARHGGEVSRGWRLGWRTGDGADLQLAILHQHLQRLIAAPSSEWERSCCTDTPDADSAWEHQETRSCCTNTPDADSAWGHQEMREADQLLRPCRVEHPVGAWKGRPLMPAAITPASRSTAVAKLRRLPLPHVEGPAALASSREPRRRTADMATAELRRPLQL
jgi:hypothetical protein